MSSTNHLAAQSFKHERVCLHSPESTQRAGRMEGARNGSTGTGVGVLTFDLRNLCKIELPPLPPQSGTPPSLRCHVDQLTGEEMSFPVSKGPTADSCFTLGRGNSSNQKSLGDVSYKPFAPENYDFLTGVTAHKPSPCSQLAVIPSWVSTCQPWAKLILNRRYTGSCSPNRVGFVTGWTTHERKIIVYLSPGPTDGGWKPPQEGQPGTRYKNKFNLEVWRAKIKLIRTDMCSLTLGKLSGTDYCSKNGIFTAETWTLYDSRTGRHCSQSERLNHQQHRYFIFGVALCAP